MSQKLCPPPSANGLGLNSLKDISTTYSYKLAGSFLLARLSGGLLSAQNTSSKLFSSILLTNFRSFILFSFFSLGIPTHTWRRVLQIKDEVDHHISVLVRNGESSYWHDQWLPCGRDALVSEDRRRILLQHSPWPVHLQQDQQDIYVWKLTSSGSFNLSSVLQSSVLESTYQLFCAQKLPINVAGFPSTFKQPAVKC
ncbi:hypothetical protein M9H77_31091 [Catharanthus roseus]|uniref:Uncharacterized protein n=1 Tax=Catharanthus roseus TaxID=4058 RepID=A0ACB9ZZF6_CATRO|nr:hypothetical protein M9H77_31091 [Catharanthus roseus]